MIGITVRDNIADLSKVVGEYQVLRGLSSKDVLTKQGGKLGREMYFSLRATAPTKGSVRALILARLKEGKGIRIRESVQRAVTAKFKARLQKKQEKFEDKFWGESASGQHNWKWLLRQRMVQAEIGLRESGRGVLGYSTRYPTTLLMAGKVLSKYKFLLSEANVRLKQDGGSASFEWSGQKQSATAVAEGIGRPRAQAAIVQAIRATKQDILLYVRRKQHEVLFGAVRKVKR